MRINTPTHTIQNFYAEVRKVCDDRDVAGAIRVVQQFLQSPEMQGRDRSGFANLGTRKERGQILQLLHSRCLLEKLSRKHEDETEFGELLQTLDDELEDFRNLLTLFSVDRYSELVPRAWRKPKKTAWWNWR